MFQTFDAKEILSRVRNKLHAHSWEEVAEALGMAGASTITNWRRRNTLDIKAIYEFADNHEVNLHWLLTGEGPESAWAVRQTIPDDVLKRFQMAPAFIASCQRENLHLMHHTVLELAKEIAEVATEQEEKILAQSVKGTVT